MCGLAQHKIRAGHFSAAETCFEEAFDIASATGQPPELYGAIKTELFAWRGDHETTRSTAKGLIEIGTAIGSKVLLFQAYRYRALSILELGAGRYDAALKAARYATGRTALGWMTKALPIVVEAGVCSGDRASADVALAHLSERAQASGTPWALGLLARSQALASDNTEAESFFNTAIEHLEQTLVATDLAHAHLVYGEWLRRQNRRADARAELRLAFEAFSTWEPRDFPSEQGWS